MGFALALAWAGIAAAVVVLALVLGWRPLSNGPSSVAFLDDAATSEQAQTQNLTTEQTRLEFDIEELPSTVAAGDDLEFLIVVRNPTDRPIALEPCPIMFSSFGESGTATFEISRLNCGEAPREIRANASVRFEWSIPIPSGSNFGFHADFVGTVYVALKNGGTDASSDPVTIR